MSNTIEATPIGMLHRPLDLDFGHMVMIADMNEWILMSGITRQLPTPHVTR